MDFKKLKSLRKEQNLTQTELSEKAGVGKVTISRLESGVLKESNVSTLLKIAKALGCEVTDIIGSFDTTEIQSTINKVR